MAKPPEHEAEEPVTNLNGSLPRPAIYARVSTEEQAQSGTSLETQVQSLAQDLKNEVHPGIPWVAG